MRIVNIVTQEEEWVTLAYLPVIRKEKEPAANERARERRCAVLQRVLYLIFRTSISASHVGVQIHHDERELLAFPRLLLYICDYPEEKAVMGLKSGMCAHPCSMCNVSVDDAGSPRALDAQDRECLRMLKKQLGLCQRLPNGNPSCAADVDDDSMREIVPALAAFAGLSTPPFLFYKIIGFDALHVRSLDCHGVRTPGACCAFFGGLSQFWESALANCSPDSPPSTLFMLMPACCSLLTCAGVGPGGDSCDDRATGASIPARMWAAPPTLWDNCRGVQNGQQADRPHGTTQQGKQNGSRVSSSADLFSASMASCVHVLMIYASIIAILTMCVKLILECHRAPHLFPRQQVL